MQDLTLHDARRSLAYWEGRLERLPRRAVRRRREAREMARRWHARVVEAEQRAYGRGLLGLLVLLVAERRLPERVRARGRQVSRVAVRGLAAAAVAVTALVVAGLAVAVDIVLHAFRAAGLL